MKNYPWDLLHQLSDRIGSVRPQLAHDDMERVLQIIASDNQRISLRKLRCAQILSFCLRGAHSGGASSTHLLERHHHMLQKLEGARSWMAAARSMHHFLDELLDLVKIDQRRDIDRFIQWMRNDMATSIERPRLLRHYADAADLSIEHLSRAFSKQTGMSFREAQKRIRFQKAKSLLREQKFKIRAVARAVGINSPSRFTSTFRRAFGVTPAVFRQMMKP